jgi:hypothetical protein
MSSMIRVVHVVVEAGGLVLGVTVSNRLGVLRDAFRIWRKWRLAAGPAYGTDAMTRPGVFVSLGRSGLHLGADSEVVDLLLGLLSLYRT